MTEDPAPPCRSRSPTTRRGPASDLDAAMRHVADDIVCDAPAGRIEGVAGVPGFIGPFVQILIGAEMLAAFGDEGPAVLVYDTSTSGRQRPGRGMPHGADGKITHSRFIFDRHPSKPPRPPIEASMVAGH